MIFGVVLIAVILVGAFAYWRHKKWALVIDDVLILIVKFYITYTLFEK